MQTVITHSGTFHADEVTAIALLQVFTQQDHNIVRIGHQDPIPTGADFVIDVGRQYDGQTLFDHHQNTIIPDQEDAIENMSSAGLIWNYLDIADMYPKITEFIRLVDQNDVGIRKASSFEYPRLIGSFNTDDIYNNNIQMLAFIDALHTAKTVIRSMKAYQDEIDEVETTLIVRLASLSEWEVTNGVLIANKYLKGWDTFLNGELTPHLRCIMWPKNDDSTEFQAQVLPQVSGKYGLHGKGFKPSDKMTFVHSNEFFCVADTKEIMLAYLADG